MRRKIMFGYLVSIIMPSYNSSSTIKRSVLSVINQTYPYWELIISDDCSKDNSLQIINDLISLDSRIVLVTSSLNTGAAATRNRAITYARGRFIAFLDSDDTWEPDKLKIQIDYMLKNNYPFTYTNYFVNKYNHKATTYKPVSRINYHKCLYNNPIGCLTAVYDTNFLGKIYMPENAPKREDYATWLNILKKVEYGYKIDECLATYYVGNNSLSSRKLKMIKHQFHLYYSVEKISFFSSLFLVLVYSLNKLFKYK
ncbi:MAG: glycosyltransferase family 2 protein [Candidatus Absconditabacteria bacterium]